MRLQPGIHPRSNHARDVCMCLSEVGDGGWEAVLHVNGFLRCVVSVCVDDAGVLVMLVSFFRGNDYCQSAALVAVVELCFFSGSSNLPEISGCPIACLEYKNI